MIFLAVIVFNSYRQKKKANALLTKQKQKIEAIHEEVSQSIDYAQRIQTSILSDNKIIQKYLSDYFVLFKPKDVVSGDFYWWAHVENHTVIAVSDCTGHGVPGAFMSMLGISLLKEIVVKEYITHTGVILRKLRKEIIKALKQKEEISVTKDGMDMALISIDHETNIVQYSGANNPLYIITPRHPDSAMAESGSYQENNNLKETDFSLSSARQNDEKGAVILSDSEESQSRNYKPGTDPSVVSLPQDEGVIGTDSPLRYCSVQNDDYTLWEIKPDKMPIAIYVRMDNFRVHEFKVKKGDQLYMFSDGFADQFGGSNGKKFKYKPFKQLLIDNCQLPMTEQKKVLEKAYTKWIGDYTQVDDITILGIKI